ncbi:MAG: HEAT repeat domain-containing protein [Pirellulales bacterium]|nr:HEAT repeat domain-containing protein [Pirellulales bacterium]
MDGREVAAMDRRKLPVLRKPPVFSVGRFQDVPRGDSFPAACLLAVFVACFCGGCEALQRQRSPDPRISADQLPPREGVKASAVASDDKLYPTSSNAKSSDASGQQSSRLPQPDSTQPTEHAEHSHDTEHTGPAHCAQCAANMSPAQQLAALASPSWFLAPLTTETSPGKQQVDHLFLERYRWRHLGIETELAIPPQRRLNLTAELAKTTQQPLRANLAIALAWQGRPQAVPVLAQVIADPQAPLPLRRAAADALGHLPWDDAVATVYEQVLPQLGDSAGPAATRYIWELHTELLESWIKTAPLPHEQILRQALHSPAAALRAQFVAAYVRWPDLELATDLEELSLDPAPVVRVAYLNMLAVRQPPNALASLRGALQDAEFDVKLAAIQGLGRLGGRSAQEALRPLTRESGELIRAAAYSALYESGDPTVVNAALADKSSQVRLGLTSTLIRRPDPALALRLLADPSVEVRKQTLAKMENWPLPLAVPVLLGACENDVLLVRQAAIRQLRESWPAANELSLTASRVQLAEQARLLKETYHREFGEHAAATDVTSRANPLTDPALSTVGYQTVAADILHELESHWRRCASRCRSTAAWERRAAIQDFTQQLAGQVIPDSTLVELTEILQTETDATVWLAALRLLAEQSDPRVAAIVALAASHPSDGVRRQSLEWFIAHPHQDYALLLQNSLADDHVAVVLAALRALAALPKLPSAQPLEELLAARDPAIRLAAAYALAAHGVPPGLPALLRLTYHDDTAIRREAATLLGKLGDLQALGELIRLLDDRPEVQLAALASLQLLTGFNAAADATIQSYAGLAQPTGERKVVDGQVVYEEFAILQRLTCHQQCLCWKQWYARIGKKKFGGQE